MKLYCITQGSEVFDLWGGEPVMYRFSDTNVDTLENHPEVLERLPESMSKNFGAFNSGLFLSEDSAWEAYFNSWRIKREKWEAYHGKKLTKENFLEVEGKSDTSIKCLSIDIPEERNVELEEFENESCANCAFDLCHGCPFCKDANGRPDQKCKHWKKIEYCD